MVLKGPVGTKGQTKATFSTEKKFDGSTYLPFQITKKLPFLSTCLGTPAIKLFLCDKPQIWAIISS